MRGWVAYTTPCRTRGTRSAWTVTGSAALSAERMTKRSHQVVHPGHAILTPHTRNVVRAGNAVFPSELGSARMTPAADVQR